MFPSKNITSALLLILLSFSTFSSDHRSPLGLDDSFKSRIKNVELQEIMFELEPKLIEKYKAESMSDKRIVRIVKGYARSLADDEIGKLQFEVLKELSPITMNGFSELPFEEHPFLATIEINYKLEQAKKLYKTTI